jgi:predicted nucleotidyltransferase
MQTEDTIFNSHGIKFDEAIELMKSFDGIVSAYVYGSVTTEYFRPDSDIDIALILKYGFNMNSISKLQLAGELSALLKREVHIGIMSKNFLIFTKEVIAKGQLLFTKDEYFSNLYNATALSMYAQLREINQEVIDAYSNR